MRNDIIVVKGTLWSYNQGLLYVRNPDSGTHEFVALDSGILGFGFRNPAPGILNPSNDWNSESTSLKIRSRWYYPRKFEAIDLHQKKSSKASLSKVETWTPRHDNGISKQKLTRGEGHGPLIINEGYRSTPLRSFRSIDRLFLSTTRSATGKHKKRRKDPEKKVLVTLCCDW